MRVLGLLPESTFFKDCLADPTIITGGLDAIDAALVGLNPDGIIVAFRGTLPPIPPITQSILTVRSFLAGF